MRTNDESLYAADHSTMPPSCLPTHLDRSNLVDITLIGETHDGAVYVAELQRPVVGGMRPR